MSETLQTPHVAYNTAASPLQHVAAECQRVNAAFAQTDHVVHCVMTKCLPGVAQVEYNPSNCLQ